MDGSTATAFIRQMESTNKPTVERLDDISRFNRSRRIPIFAISATLLESKRLEYMETGFDGWILKPVDFKRLEVLIKGISDLEIRKQATYTPGKWAMGGWLLQEVVSEKKHSSRNFTPTNIGRRLSITPGGWPVGGVDGNHSPLS